MSAVHRAWCPALDGRTGKCECSAGTPRCPKTIELPFVRCVLGLDPGFASLGYAVVAIGDELRCLALGVLRTKPSGARRRVLQVEDNVQRCRELVRELHGIIQAKRPGAICAESVSHPRNASAAAKVSMAWGVIVTLSELDSMPLLQLSPQDVKQRVSGSKSASKEEVAFDVRRRLGNDCERLLAGLPEGVHEHAWDAAAVALACFDSDVVRALRGAA